MQPGFSLFGGAELDRMSPILLREKSCASRDSQVINNFLNPKMFLEDLLEDLHAKLA